jgi:hypothetical protein
VNIGLEFFAHPVTEFLRKHPRTKVGIVLSDERLDLVAIRIDVALRIGEMPNSTVVARRLGPARRLFCASPSYLAARGTPLSPDELKQHDCIVSGSSTAGVSWPYRGSGGDIGTVAIAGAHFNQCHIRRHLGRDCRPWHRTTAGSSRKAGDRSRPSDRGACGVRGRSGRFVLGLSKHLQHQRRHPRLHSQCSRLDNPSRGPSGVAMRRW